MEPLHPRLFEKQLSVCVEFRISYYNNACQECIVKNVVCILIVGDLTLDPLLSYCHLIRVTHENRN